MTEIPAVSRSDTSSRKARPSCLAWTDWGTSSRGKLQRRMVIGPVNIPFTRTISAFHHRALLGFLVRLWAYLDSLTVMGAGRETSPTIIGGLT